MKLSDVNAMVGGELLGDDAELRSVSIDTRTLRPGDLFVALRGPRFDGHAFIDQAQRKGAAGAMVSTAPQTVLPLIRVADTRRSLGDWARAWRQRFTLPVIGVTGSNGKTTVKEMLAGIFRQHRKVLVTRGNFNNDIGVPLMLLQLDASHQCAVIEMGANHAGEIDYLTRLVQPTVALITNAGPAHLEGFGTLDGVAHAKGEIFAGLGRDDTAVINADDRYAGYWRQCAGGRPVVTFGIDDESATVRATDIRPGADNAAGTSFIFQSPAGSVEIRLPLAGRHNVMNALAAGAAALAAGAGLDAIRAGLQAMLPVGGRLERKVTAHGVTVIDDTYNANPASVAAALAVLHDAPGRRLLVIGDMGELGGNAALLHEDIGRQARAAGIDALYATGPLSRRTADAFGAGGCHFASHTELLAALQADLEPMAGQPVTVLIKGSRSARMETVVQGLAGAQDSPAAAGNGGHG